MFALQNFDLLTTARGTVHSQCVQAASSLQSIPHSSQEGMDSNQTRLFPLKAIPYSGQFQLSLSNVRLWFFSAIDAVRKIPRKAKICILASGQFFSLVEVPC